MKQKIRLSQCMIVKDEEKNIGKALSWGKGIAFEQIVVDTGSTDKTVQIAQEMGAKVYHFDWIDDFSAAKNFAIEQATGKWIAFLDADEYFSIEDAGKLHGILENIDKEQRLRGETILVQCSMVHLDEYGKPFSAMVHKRVFSNTSKLRYVNKIHEMLRYSGAGRPVTIDASKSLNIFHTGYSASIYKETKKLDRNIEMLKLDLERDPSNRDSWSYLGDAYVAAKMLEEAVDAYDKALANSNVEISEQRYNTAYSNRMRLIVLFPKEGSEELLTQMYEDYQKGNYSFPDISYWMGSWFAQLLRYEEAVPYLKKALEELEQYQGTATLAIAGKLEEVYMVLMVGCRNMEDDAQAVKYGVLAIRRNHYSMLAVNTVLTMFMDETGPEGDALSIFGFLDKIYDFTKLKDKLFIIKAAKKIGFTSLYQIVFEMLDKEEQKWLLGPLRSPYCLTQEQFAEQYPMIVIKNGTDVEFLTLIEEIRSKSEIELIEHLKGKFAEMQQRGSVNYNTFVDYFSRFPFWGELRPENDVYDALTGRIQSMKGHMEEFLWLYSHLADYRSKKTLLAILDNWLNLNFQLLPSVTENGFMYFDQDLIPDGKDAVYVDLGSYAGDSVNKYIRAYGENYRKIHCYEVTPESIEHLNQSIQCYDQIEVHQKAVGSGNGTAYLHTNQDSAMNQVLEYGKTPVEVVSLDEDIKEKISFIKMDIEGSEQKALTGCSCHIRKEHPKLAIAAYHGYEDIWKLPRIIAELDPQYKFYLRNYGGNLIPTEFIIYAV